jgi:hypothetical protein
MPNTTSVARLGLLVWLLAMATACSKSSGGSSLHGPDGGGGSTANGGSSGSGQTGDFGSIWKAVSGDVAVIDNASPSAPQSAHVDIPSTNVNGATGEAVDAYLKFEGDTLVTYAWSEGDQFYHRIREAGQADATSFTPLSSAGASLIRSYTLDHGVLTCTGIQTVGDQAIYLTTTYAAYTGTFPPPSWPKTMVESQP